MRRRILLETVLFLLMASLPLAAQTTSGSIVGTVEDRQGGAVRQATVVVTDPDNGISRTTFTDSLGHFAVLDLQPGRYTVMAKSPGFKELVRPDVILNANTSLSIGTLTLQVGEVVQEVKVLAYGEQLQTETAERSESILGEQLENIEVNGRSYLGLLRLVPGIYNDGDYSSATVNLGGIYTNGSRGNQANVTLNGAGNVDTGSNGGQMATISLDSVQEFKVLTSNYQAQYGRSAGAQISVVSKSGKKNFYGSGYWYHRNESLNANNWINNRDGLPRNIFRANDFGYTVGGPVYVPRKFNTNKDKMFFFWSQERQHQFLPESLHRVTVPTALERQGDFSQSVDKNGKPFNLIRDPLSGKPCTTTNRSGCFQDGGVLGRIPNSRLYAPGLAILNLFPLPNAASPLNKGFNYQSQDSRLHPRREDLIRLDYNLSPKWRLFGSYLDNFDSVTNAYGSFRMQSNIPLVPIQDARPGHVFVISATTILSPTSANEAKFDLGHNQINIEPATDGVTRAKTGLNLNTFFPPYKDLIPHFSFNGSRIANSPSINTNNGPFFNYNSTIEWIDNLSKIWNQHFIKTGIYIQRNRKDQDTSANFNGDYNFGDSSNNLFDTGFGFANGALGIFTSLNQASQFARGKYRYTNLEFYVQDTWKALPRLTLDYGVRFYWIQPQYDAALQTSNFFPDRWNPSQAPRLYWPDLDSKGQRVARDPVTGQTLPAYAIGTIVPNSGNLMNGIVQAGHGASKYLVRDPGILPGPRVGLTVDLTGHQNLILRAGGGVYYDRYQGNEIFRLLTNPPTAFTPTAENGFLQDVSLNAAIAPSTLEAISFDGKIPTIYNYSAGIQSRLPWAMNLDLSYVGSVSRHLIVLQNLNAIPYGATFLAQNQDPTKVKANPNARLGSNTYDANFLRPYQGYGDIKELEFGSTANYNSFQVSLKRRFAKGLFLGVAYTWSKCMTVASGDGDYIRVDNLTRLANYGPCSFDIRNNFAANYVYGLPSLTSRFGSLNHAVTRALLNNWQISGVTIFRNGPPYAVGFSVPGIGNAQLTGSYTEGARVKLIGNPFPRASDSPYDRLSPAAFAPPDVGSIGMDSPVNYLAKPGTNNWDMSLQRNVPLKEGLSMQIRLDAFNAFNHTQFNGINSKIDFSGLKNPLPTNLPFDGDGNLVDRLGFATVSGVRNPRTLQLVVRMVF